MGLMEYQRFEREPELQSVIDAVHARYATRELNADELERVSAAGVAEQKPDRPELDKK